MAVTVMWDGQVQQNGLVEMGLKVRELCPAESASVLETQPENWQKMDVV